MNLMLLDKGGLSLEFASSDFEVVGQAMRELGAVTCEEGVTNLVYHVDGARLVYTDDWDDPCLVAGDENGVRVLRALFDRLVERTRLLPRAA